MGSIVLVCLMSAGVILYGAKLRINILHQVDSVHRQYEAEYQINEDVKTRLSTIRGDIHRYAAVPADRQKLNQNINDNLSAVTEAMKGYQDKSLNEDAKNIILAFDAAWPDLQRGYKGVIEGSRSRTNRRGDPSAGWRESGYFGANENSCCREQLE